MRKKRILTVFAVHLLLAVLLSLDLWGGDYMGFLPTFGALYLLTLPIPFASFAISRALRAMKSKTGGVTELLCGVLGTAVLVIFVLSALGVLSGSAFLPIAYFIVFGGTVVMLFLMLFLRFRKG